MASGIVTVAERREGLLSRVADWAELTKPRIGFMVLVTVAVAASVSAWGAPPASLLWHTLLGTAAVAASAGILNQWLETDCDARMRRTAARPLPAGRIVPAQAMALGLVTIVLGVVYLAWMVRPLTAALALLTWVLYLVVYTPLKRRTPQNTAIGAVGGALPVLIGWSATGAPWDLGAAVLFTVLYLWQFPHFMAIAWLYRDDYRDGGLQMLTVVDPSGRRAGAQAVVASLALLPVGVLPATLLEAGLGYLVWSLVWGLGYVAVSAQFARRPDNSSARLLMRYSLLHLPCLLAPLAFLTGGR